MKGDGVLCVTMRTLPFAGDSIEVGKSPPLALAASLMLTCCRSFLVLLMSLPKSPKALLQETIAHGRAIMVSGAGVSIAASDCHPQASWTGLLENGLERCSNMG